MRACTRKVTNQGKERRTLSPFKVLGAAALVLVMGIGTVYVLTLSGFITFSQVYYLPETYRSYDAMRSTFEQEGYLFPEKQTLNNQGGSQISDNEPDRSSTQQEVQGPERSVASQNTSAYYYALCCVRWLPITKHEYFRHAHECAIEIAGMTEDGIWTATRWVARFPNQHTDSDEQIALSDLCELFDKHTYRNVEINDCITDGDAFPSKLRENDADFTYQVEKAFTIEGFDYFVSCAAGPTAENKDSSSREYVSICEKNALAVIDSIIDQAERNGSV